MKRMFIDKETGKVVAVRGSSIRVYMPKELIDLLSRYDLEVEKLYGDYRMSEYRATSPRLIVVAKKR
ncbi:MAG: hypothetical protein DRJ40_05775 [Thermoprotei archaeon]|nr:MAG: hypothetical protein DRJ40_05775 [Thermoprotei archaeon]